MTTRLLVEDQTALDQLVSDLRGDDTHIAVDTETNGLSSFHGDRITGISFYFPLRDTSYYIAFRHGEGFNWPLSTLKTLQNAYPMPDKTYVFFNAKFDIHMLYADGFDDPRNIEDVMIAAHLLNENEALVAPEDKKSGFYQLKYLASRYVSASSLAGEQELKARAKARGFNPKSEMWKLPASDVATYAMMDTEITWQLREVYRPNLTGWNQWDLYQQRSHFLLNSLVRMERTGIQVSVDTIHQHRETLKPQQERLNYTLVERAIARGHSRNLAFNPKSPLQLLEFFKLGGHTHITDTSKTTLQDLADSGSQDALDVLRYRVVSKADSTYYRRYLRDVDDQNRIHASFNVIGANTGRLSSSNPNLQQIPHSGVYHVKNVFVAPEGFSIGQADYKAMELRLATFYAREEKMQNLFKSGIDPHTYTANQIDIRHVVFNDADDYDVLLQWGIPARDLDAMDDAKIEKDALKTLRFLGKRANFGLLYGMGHRTAAALWGIEEDAARVVCEEWHSLYPRFKQAVIRYSELAQEWRPANGNSFQYLRLPLTGRTRKFHLYAQGDAPYYTGGFNFIIQGTGAAVTELSIMRLCDRYPSNEDLVPVATVHDSFIFYVRNAVKKRVVSDLVTVMQDWPDFDPPLTVDVELGDSWGSMVEYDL